MGGKPATYTKEQREQIDKQLRQLTDEERKELAQQGAQILRGRMKDKQREYNVRYRQRIALAARMGLTDKGDPA